MPQTLAIAHRGDPVAARENTMAAFDAAVRHGADMVELDLRRAKDGTIVVVHDATLGRLWGDERAVSDLDLEDIRRIGQGDIRIPTFVEVLDAFGIPLMVDFTGPEVVEAALRAATEASALSRCLFVSGHLGVLRHLRAHSSRARIGLSWIERDPPSSTLLRELGAEFWNPFFALAKTEHVAAVHELGIGVSTWTVDKTRHMARVKKAGVDAIVSNQIVELVDFLS